MSEQDTTPGTATGDDTKATCLGGMGDLAEGSGTGIVTGDDDDTEGHVFRGKTGTLAEGAGTTDDDDTEGIFINRAETSQPGADGHLVRPALARGGCRAAHH